jgi:hypothetical protein
MTEDRFLRLLMTYGADRERWPDDVREAAEGSLWDELESVEDIRHEAALDRLLHDAAPMIGAARVEDSVAEVLRRVRDDEDLIEVSETAALASLPFARRW